MNTLLTWLGTTDLENMEEGKPAAIATMALDHPQAFNNIVVLANSWYDKLLPFHNWLSRWLADNGRPCESIQVKTIKLTSPVHYPDIFAVTEQWVTQLAEKSDTLTINITSGTPAMSVASVLIGKAKDNVFFYQSSKDKGISEAVIPVDFGQQYSKSAAKTVADKAVSTSYNTITFSSIIAESPAMKETLQQAKKLATSEVPLLILGETGSGKESMARAIHSGSFRANQSLRIVNCGALPESLVDSILFGHVKGAFTGALSDKKGLFEQANGGTLFLDEVGELKPDTQVKLLRALQDGEINRVGDDKLINVDVRVVAATHRDLVRMMLDGEFREDLFYRLAVGIIKIPSLRERIADIRPLVSEFSAKINTTSQKQPGYKSKNASEKAINFIEKQPWPGNIRELWNTLNRVFITSENKDIDVDDIQNAIIKRETKANSHPISLVAGQQVNVEQAIDEIKKSYVEAALSSTANHYTNAAKMLGLKNRQTLMNWMKSLGIEQTK